MSLAGDTASLAGDTSFANDVDCSPAVLSLAGDSSLLAVAYNSYYGVECHKCNVCVAYLSGETSTVHGRSERASTGRGTSADRAIAELNVRGEGKGGDRPLGNEMCCYQVLCPLPTDWQSSRILELSSLLEMRGISFEVDWLDLTRRVENN